MFIGVVGSTAMGEKLEPEDIQVIMDGALKSFTGIVDKHKGRMLQYTGDGMLSAFGADEGVENIQKTVADFYKIKVADMYSKKRPASIARPRQIAMYLAKDMTKKSLREIGYLFGGRDHTTVLHAVRKITAERTVSSGGAAGLRGLAGAARIGRRVAMQLPADRRRRSTDHAADVPHTCALNAQAGDYDTLLGPELLVAPSNFHLGTSSADEVLHLNLEAALPAAARRAS